MSQPAIKAHGVNAIVNGQHYELTYDETTGKYYAECNAPSISSYNNNSDHYFDVSLSAENVNGNITTVDSTTTTLVEGSTDTIGSRLRLVVKEEVAPIVRITSPSNGAYLIDSNPTVRFTITDNTIQTTGFSGVDRDSCVISVNGTTIADAISWDGDDSALTGEVTLDGSLNDGENTITITCKDHDENDSNVASVTFTVDTVAPTLSISAPADNLKTNIEQVTVVGTTNDITSKPVIVTITNNGVDQGEVVVNANGEFSKEITLNDGDNTLIITSTDKAGQSSSLTTHVNYSLVAPIFKNVVIIPNPTKSGKAYRIEVEVM